MYEHSLTHVPLSRDPKMKKFIDKLFAHWLSSCRGALPRFAVVMLFDAAGLDKGTSRMGKRGRWTKRRFPGAVLKVGN